MTNTPSVTTDAAEAEDMGEKPDLGRTPDSLADALNEALSGTDSGSDTRAGSLRGGSASGSEIDPDQDAVNAALAEQGRALRREQDGRNEASTGGDHAGPTASDGRATSRKDLSNTGSGPGESPGEGRGAGGDDADAATG